MTEIFTPTPDATVESAGDTGTTPLFGVGERRPRFDATGRVRGTIRYVADEAAAPGTAFVAVHRSTMPHARILSVDVAGALKQEGVLQVVTGRDLHSGLRRPDLHRPRLRRPALPGRGQDPVRRRADRRGAGRRRRDRTGRRRRDRGRVRRAAARLRHRRRPRGHLLRARRAATQLGLRRPRPPQRRTRHERELRVPPGRRGRRGPPTSPRRPPSTPPPGPRPRTTSRSSCPPPRRGSTATGSRCCPPPRPPPTSVRRSRTCSTCHCRASGS